MVSCSVAIHVLSIPGFSLGRRVHSVSRTWSRRDWAGSRTVAPNWTNQARLVTMAEDIVINRDEMEEEKAYRWRKRVREHLTTLAVRMDRRML